MDLGLADRVALVAGGSQGLGKAVALEMSREGAKVVICALDDPELPRAVEDIKAATGGEIIGVPADVTDPVEVTFLLLDQTHVNECVDGGNQSTVSDMKFCVSGRWGIRIRTPGILGRKTCLGRDP